MKTRHLLTALFISSAATAQNNDYAITSYAEEGLLAPNTHYLGEAWLQFAMPADSLTGYGITKAMFKANSTLNWHKHSSVQVLAIYGGTTPTEWTEELTREAYDAVAEKLATSK